MVRVVCCTFTSDRSVLNFVTDLRLFHRWLSSHSARAELSFVRSADYNCEHPLPGPLSALLCFWVSPGVGQGSFSSCVLPQHHFSCLFDASSLVDLATILKMSLLFMTPSGQLLSSRMAAGNTLIPLTLCQSVDNCFRKGVGGQPWRCPLSPRWVAAFWHGPRALWQAPTHPHLTHT